MSWPACWRNDAVHAQIFHHLTIVIVGVGYSVNCKLNASILPDSADPGSEYWSHRIFCRDSSRRRVQGNK